MRIVEVDRNTFGDITVRGRKSLSFFGLMMMSLLLMSCSTTSWMVQEDSIDPNDFEKIKTTYFLDSVDEEVRPDQPIVRFELNAVETYEYAKRVKTQRYIQRYRPRLSYVLLGMAGTGLSYYAALSDNLVQRPTDEQRYALMGAGTMLTGLSFLNMKPIGEPTPTGEARLLRKTGTVREVDTVSVYPYSSGHPHLIVLANNKVLVDEPQWQFEGKNISINMADEINASQFNGDEDVDLLVEAYFDSMYAAKTIPLSSVFEQFVVVNSQISALRNAPNSNPDNILTDLAVGSQLKLVSTEGNWHKVMYGISETWISAKDVRTIWRPSEFASDLSVITIPNVPFGSIDVEQNIPVVGKSELNSSAFIISNHRYSGDLTERTYGERDAKLMEEYFIQAFGIRESRIVRAPNISNDNQADRVYARLANSLDKNQSLTIYLSGYGEIKNSQLYLIGTDEKDGERQYVDLQKLFRALSKLELKILTIYADLDIINRSGSTRVLENLAGIVTDEIFDSAVIFSSKPGQRSHIYSSPQGEKKRHSIFTYFLADAIKQRNVTLNFLFSHIDRNVSFTSRSLHDRPQTPLFYGNRGLKLVN